MGLFKSKKEEEAALPQHKNLVSAMQYSQKITLITVIGAFLTAIVVGILSLDAIQEAKSEIYVVDQKTGEVQTVKAARLRDHREVEVRANTELFVDRFFALNPTTYKKKMEQAIEMGDGSIYQMYEVFKSLKWYEKTLQDNIFFTPSIYNYQADMNKIPYEVSFDLDLLLNTEVRNPQVFSFHLSCSMQEMDERNEKTPHALFITNMVILQKNKTSK